VDETFSWVEPTAWGLLALKAAPHRPPAATARIDEAERLLFDRACDPGGWNYGNPNVFGQPLRPYVPTTALGLVALQDRRDHPVVRAAIEWLDANWRTEESGFALALAAMALHVLDAPTTPIVEHLTAHVDTVVEFGNLHVAAMALCATGGAWEALRI
jgi:hypothetical protein